MWILRTIGLSFLTWTHVELFYIKRYRPPPPTPPPPASPKVTWHLMHLCQGSKNFYTLEEHTMETVECVRVHAFMRGNTCQLWWPFFWCFFLFVPDAFKWCTESGKPFRFFFPHVVNSDSDSLSCWLELNVRKSWLSMYSYFRVFFVFVCFLHSFVGVFDAMFGALAFQKHACYVQLFVSYWVILSLFNVTINWGASITIGGNMITQD